MTFTYRPFDGTAMITVSRDELTGDAELIRLVERYLLDYDQACLPPVGPCLPVDRTDLSSMLLVCVNALGYGDVVSGDEPPLDNELPDGAIA